MLKNEQFEREHPGAGVVLKRGTAGVPKDGKYHLFAAGQLVNSYRSKRAAMRAYEEAVARSGWKPDAVSKAPPDFGKMATDKFFDDYEGYWSRASSFTPKGGKGR